MSSTDLNTLKQRLRERLRANTGPTWAKARDWDQKNLSMAHSAEVAEITGYFQFVYVAWKDLTPLL
jgi:hypothetical protein